MTRIVLFGVLFLASGSLADGIPTIEPLAYSGVLQNSVGAPVTSTVSARLSLWDDQTATLSTNRKCETSVATLTPDSAGRFRIILEATCLAAVKTNPNLWVQVEIGATALPRTKLGAVPYAVEADRAGVASAAAGQLAAQFMALDAGFQALAARVAALETGRPVVTPWVAYAPVVRAGASTVVTTVNITAFWRRVGDSLEVEITSNFPACSPFGQITWSLPGTLAPDTTKLASIATVGQGTLFVTTVKSMHVTYNGRIAADLEGDPGGGMNCDDVRGADVRLFFTIPIQGWTVTSP
jgi:hypothetical protein